MAVESVQRPEQGGVHEEAVAEAARVAARAQAELEMEMQLLAEEEAREEWELAENRRINHAITLSIAAQDFAEAGDFKAAVESARQALGLDNSNIEARAVLNYCRSYRRASRSAAPTRPKLRASSTLISSSRSSLSLTSLVDGPAFAVLDGDTTRRTVVGRRPVSASSSFGAVESSLNRKPRTLYVLNGSSAASRRRTRARATSAQSGNTPDISQVSYQLLRESGSTAWVTVGPAPDDVAWTGDRELLDRVQNLESALADMLAEPEPEPDVPTFETQTAVRGESLDVWHYVYTQAAHLYSFIPGETIEVLNRRRVTDKESGEMKVEETWHPAVVTRYDRPYLSDEERTQAEIEARERHAAERTAKAAAPAIFEDDDGAKAAAADARQARRAAARAQALEAELSQLSVGGLRAKAASFGIKNIRIEAAWKSADPNKELIDLIVGFAEEAHESDEEADKAEAEAEANASCVIGLLDSWSVHFVYQDGREPPRWRAGQPLHGAEVSLLLAPPVAALPTTEAESQRMEKVPQQGANMVRRIRRPSVDWASVAELKELEASQLEATAARETQEEHEAAARAATEQKQAEDADALADEEEAQAVAAAAALAAELEESAVAKACADAEAADVSVAAAALRLAIESGDEKAIAAAEAELQQEKTEADESRLKAEKEEAEAREARARHAAEEDEAKAARESANKEQAEAEHFRLIYEKEKAEAIAARAEAKVAREKAAAARAIADQEKAGAEAALVALAQKQEQLTRTQAETEELRARIRLMEETEAHRLEEAAAKATQLEALAEQDQVPMSKHIAALDEREARAEVLSRELAELQADNQRLQEMLAAEKTGTNGPRVLSAMPQVFGSIFCTIVGCDNLLVADSTSSSPFVAIWFGNEELIHQATKPVAAIPKKATVTDGTVNSGWCRTEMVKNTISPKFSNGEFEFQVGPDLNLRNMHLHLRVFDHDRFSSNDQLGEYDVHLCQCFGEEWTHQTYSNTVELVDYRGKVKSKFVKRRISDLVDHLIANKSSSLCDLKQALLNETIYGRLTFTLRFQPHS